MIAGVARGRAGWSLGWTVAASLTVGYCIVFGAFSGLLPLQDFPNHLARAVVMSDLLFRHGGAYAGLFDVRLLPVPYVLGDVLLAAAIATFGTTLALALANTLVLLSLPAALHYTLGGLHVSGERRALGWILGLYLATDWFYVKGFFAYRLAVALTLLSFGIALRLRERWTAPGYAAFAATVIVGYLVHLTAPAFCATALAATALAGLARRRSAVRREFALLAPLAAVFLWQAAIASRFAVPGDAVSHGLFWGTAADKLVHVDWEFLRYRPHVDRLLLAAFLACLLWTVRGHLRRASLGADPAFGLFLSSAAFLGLYVLLPVGYRDAWWVDVRAAEMCVVFLLLACLTVPGVGAAAGSGGLRPQPLALALCLAVANAAYLAGPMFAERAWIDAYRRVAAAVPAGATVLPVHTRLPEGAVRPFLHAGAFVVIDAHALIPYLFSGDGGYPMKYFRYRHRPPAPDDDWYTAHRAVDWRAVGCDYDYLLITRPYDPARLGVATSTTAENAAAALLKIDRRCP